MTKPTAAGILLGMVMLISPVWGAASPTTNPNNFDVRSYGAVGDGSSKDTAAFQKALDACAAASGGDVVVPAGNYLIGSITLGSGTTLRLEKGATLTGSPDIADYPLISIRFEGETVQGHRALIYADKANKIGIVGPGMLMGDSVLGDLRNPRGPAMVEFVDCSQIRLEDFSDRYRRMWSIHLQFCRDVVAKNLTIRTQRNNGDGIDVDSTSDVLIDHCDIDTGDDSISLKSGRGAAAAALAKPTENVVITDCKLGSDFAGIGIGTEMSAGIRNVKIEHCNFPRGANAIYLKSRSGRGGFIENISGDDLEAASKVFLGIDLLDKGIVGSDPIQGPVGIPRMDHISLNHVRVHVGTLVDGLAVSSEKPVDALSLTDITGTCKKGISLANVTGAHLSGINVSGYSGPLLVTQNVSGDGLEGAVRPTTRPSGRRASADPRDIGPIQSAFADPPDDARPIVRWWWFGPAVTKPELQREITAMHDAGFGGFEVQPTYPLAVNDHPAGLVNLKFLSPQFLDDLGFVAAKAKDAGLRMDLTLGSGWPYGGTMFPITEAAGRLRIARVKTAVGQSAVNVPALHDGESLIAAFSAGNEIAVNNGSVQIPADLPEGSDIHFFISSRTGMKVKRPALNAEGYVIDHDSPPVVQKFIDAIAEKEVAACGENVPHSVFCDSLEVGGEDWTANFLDEFQKRRGYDLRPLLTALMDDTRPRALDIRHDWGQTLTEIFDDYFVKRFQDFAHDHNTLFRIQAYGSPSAGLCSYADCDLPEGEGYQWHGYRATRYATSACHLMGVPVSSSETFTWIHAPVFRATPLDIKAEADLHFLQGVNQIICHGWPYTATGIADPGWSFYAAGVFDEKNPWWFVMPEVNKYLQRMSFILRQGRPANDIALYLSNSDAWAHFTPGKISLSDGVGQELGPRIVGRILDSGYNLDFFDDGMLDRFGRVENGTLAFGHQEYKVVVLAGVERIPPTTLRKLQQFAAQGGIVVATRRLPELAPGYLATDRDQQAVHDIAQQMFVGRSARESSLKMKGSSLALATRFPPDITFSPGTSQVGFVHRHTDAGEIYFIANTANQPVNIKATFQQQGRNPEWWDPMTGKATAAEVIDRSIAGPSVIVNLEPYGSTVLVWTNRQLPDAAVVREVVSPPPLDLSGDWTLQLGPGATPASQQKLHPWTDDAQSSSFSGIGSYTRKISVSSDLLRQDLRLTMDFGASTPLSPRGNRNVGTGFEAELNPPVHEAAIAYINGKPAGSLWHPPYTLDVSGLLHAGENDIRIDVANTMINSLSAAGFPNYDYSALLRQFGNRFQPAPMAQFQPVPSGLSGPIQLIASQAQ